jgi:hypothetical protein
MNGAPRVGAPFLLSPAAANTFPRMSLFRFTLAAALLATPLAAQSRPPVLAFPRSLGPAIGVASFNPRSTSSGASFSYKGSVVVSGKFDMPLTRRTGLLLSAGIAPLSQQRGQSSSSTVLSDKLMVGVLDAGIGFRFKPSAPVFFAGGGGLTYSTRPPVPESTGSVMEPHVLLAIGYDAGSSDSWNIRTVLNNRFVIVGDDGMPETVDESMAYDWSFDVVFRYRFKRSAP